MKKAIALMLALVLALGMTFTAFAAFENDTAAKTDTTSGGDITKEEKTDRGSKAGATINIGTLLYLPDITVTIAPPSKVAINPYKMNIIVEKVNGVDTSVDESVIAAPSIIKNKSNVDVEITLSATGSGTDFATTKKEYDDSDHATLYMGIQMRKSADAKADADCTIANIGTGTGAWIEDANGLAEADTKTAIIGTSTKKGADGTITLTKRVEASTPDPEKYYFAAYQVVGDANSFGWGDGADITISATFIIKAKAGTN